MPESQRQIIGRYGANVSWSRTPDRSARTRPARASSPASREYHLKRLPEQFDDAPQAARLAAAESAKKAYFSRLAMLSAASRRRGGDAA
jgi:hypothetical protein